MRVFITGVSSGIGRELAKQLVSRGHHVWGVARREKELDQLSEEVGERAFYFSVCDVADPDSVEQVILQMRERGFIPDAVVLNAGVYEADLDPDYDHAKAVKVFNINLYGALIWVEKLLPVMSGKDRQFIVISSLARFRPDIYSVSYPASKAALSMAIRSLRLKYGAAGLKFKTVHFGPVATFVIPRYRQAKKSVFVLSAERAAGYILRALNRDKEDFYYPFLFSAFIKLSLWIPDKVFHKLTQKLRR